VNGDFPLSKEIDLRLVIIHADEIHPELCQTGSCHQSHITCPDHTDIHDALRFFPHPYLSSEGKGGSEEKIY
jgi:hypothetical protein